jgi:NAD(P)-dependent dehydrogenase (short-subunit alcohol dehydrogenase family)
MRVGKDTVVVITGASGGVGRATARLLAERGAKVALLARGREGLEGARRDVEERGGRALVLPTDVSRAEQVEAAAEAAERELGPIDAWVNNAMVSMYSRFSEMTPDEFKHVVEVTFLGNVYGTHAALKRMRPRDRGVVIQVGSALAFRSIPLQSAYCASKHAIEGFTESVRSELLHEQSHVRISSVHMPALNTTQFTWTKNNMPQKVRPAGRIYQPEVAADAILFMLEHARRSLKVGYTTIEATLGEKVMPGLLDRYLARTAWDGALLPDAKDPAQPDNFWQPVTADLGAHGGFDAKASSRSPALWASKHRLLLGGATVAGALALVGLWSNGSSRSRWS